MYYILFKKKKKMSKNNVTTKSVSLKPQSIQLFIEMTLETLTKTDEVQIFFDILNIYIVS